MLGGNREFVIRKTTVLRGFQVWLAIFRVFSSEFCCFFFFSVVFLHVFAAFPMISNGVFFPIGFFSVFQGISRC